jgi:hypothetical protein
MAKYINEKEEPYTWKHVRTVLGRGMQMDKVHFNNSLVQQHEEPYQGLTC